MDDAKTVAASAPNKIHIAGEHSVVYGGLALIAPVEVNGRRNIISITERKGEPKIIFYGDLGTTVFYADGKVEGSEIYHPIKQIFSKIFENEGKKFYEMKKTVLAKLDFSGAPKGTGNSASISAAFALAFYGFLGHKPTRSELFEAAFAGDNAWHGGKSSGGDVQAVLSDCPQLFLKKFSEGKAEFFYENVELELPKGTKLLLIKHFFEGEPATTAEQISKFAEVNDVEKKPEEMTEEERQRITAPFDGIVKKIEGELHSNGNPEVLGELFNENHLLLREKNVSCDEIEKALETAKMNGALGAKLVGAGGKGGAAIALVLEKDAARVKKALAKIKAETYEIVFARKGVCLE